MLFVLYCIYALDADNIPQASKNFLFVVCILRWISRENQEDKNFCFNSSVNFADSFPSSCFYHYSLAAFFLFRALHCCTANRRSQSSTYGENGMKMRQKKGRDTNITLKEFLNIFLWNFNCQKIYKKFPIIHFLILFSIKKDWPSNIELRAGKRCKNWNGTRESCKIRNVDPITFFIIRCHKSFTLLKLLKLMIFFCCSLNLHSACLLAIFSGTQFSSFLFIGLSSTNPMRSGKIKKSPEKSRSINVRGALGSFWQWLITSLEGETRACLLANFFLKWKSNTRVLVGGLDDEEELRVKRRINKKREGKVIDCK